MEGKIELIGERQVVSGSNKIDLTIFFVLIFYFLLNIFKKYCSLKSMALCS